MCESVSCVPCLARHLVCGYCTLSRCGRLFTAFGVCCFRSQSVCSAFYVVPRDCPPILVAGTLRRVLVGKIVVLVDSRKGPLVVAKRWPRGRSSTARTAAPDIQLKLLDKMQSQKRQAVSRRCHQVFQKPDVRLVRKCRTYRASGLGCMLFLARTYDLYAS